MAAQKFITNVAGVLTEKSAMAASAGVGDADKLVALNASGVLAASIVNSVTTSAGAGDSAKVVALDGTGRVDNSMMPVGIGADTASITASEALAAGDFVNVWDSAGAFRARKADATTAGKQAMGFVLAAVSNAAQATVYFEGTNNQVTGATPGQVFLATTAGGFTSTAPSASGNAVQSIGFATSATSINFQASQPIVLA